MKEGKLQRGNRRSRQPVLLGGEPPDGPFLHCLFGKGSTFESGFVSDPSFTKAMNHLLGPPLLEGNRITELLNGDEFFPAILESIREAQRSVTVETYMWSSGTISDAFIDALTEKAGEGVKVHAMVDGVGALKLKRSDMERLKQGGVQFTYYQRPRWYHPKWNIGHRTHRKIFVVDGSIAITGGMCIDDRWLGDGRSSLSRWRDNGYLFRGPVVAQMQAAFVENWTDTTSQVLAGPDYFPELEPAGDQRAQVYRGGLSERYGSVRLAVLLSIAAAERHVRIAHSYFIPDAESVTLLVAAREKGVKVEVIVPYLNDTALGRAGSRSTWGELLGAGVEIYRYEPAMYHCKYIIIDDCWVVAGSANFDNRSMLANDECNFNVYDRGFADAQIRVFEQDRACSRRFTSDDLKRRPIPQKTGDRLVGIFRRWL